VRLVRVTLALLAALVLSSAASAAPPAVSVIAVPASGVAPLRVTLTASGDAAGYTWDLGDGGVATGSTVSHVYAAGRFVATVTATSESGESTQAQVEVVAASRTVTLTAPRVGDYGGRATLSGKLGPPVPGGRVQIYRGRTYVASARVRRGGRFRTHIRLRTPGRYEARYGRTRSAPRAIRVRPLLEASVAPTTPAGGRLVAFARLVPAVAGRLRIEARRGRRLVGSKTGAGTLRLVLPTRTAGKLSVRIVSRGRPGWASLRRTLSSNVVLPALAFGSRGPSVLTLERRLAELRYAIRGTDGVYGTDTLEAVTAFQKVNRLPRTGRVEASLWRLLARAAVPLPRYGGADHIEIDKTRQVLFEVSGGRVTRVVHVSTGATGNTPLGTWHVYRKVVGFDWVLWYPMYFLRGFAIHGYPFVPAYPASHGCVRVPMWIAPILFAAHPHGATIAVYL
jgi:PKD repeat protein